MDVRVRLPSTCIAPGFISPVPSLILDNDNVTHTTIISVDTNSTPSLGTRLMIIDFGTPDGITNIIHT